PGNSGCPFFLWGLLAFLGLALLISVIFNISHYVEKQRQREPMDEDCYEQMKARPQRSVSDMQEATASAQVPAESQMCYATLDHSIKGKRRRPRKQNAYFSDREKDAQVCAMDTSVSQNNLVPDFSSDNQAVEESVHDDPARLFGLIRAKREPVV
ncbi:T-cell receptor-associated transmembrane adapter 1, partial [Microtus ochrogaster]